MNVHGLRRSWELVASLCNGGGSGVSFLPVAFQCHQLCFPVGEVFTFSENLFRVALWSPSSGVGRGEGGRGSGKELLPSLNSYGICGLHHRFAIDRRLSCIVLVPVLTFSPNQAGMCPGLTSGSLTGWQAGMAKPRFPSVLCPHHPVLFFLLCLCPGTCTLPSVGQICRQREAEILRTQLPSSVIRLRVAPGLRPWEDSLP